MSTDPLEAVAPHKSTYSFAANSPIFKLDINGLFAIDFTRARNLSTEDRAVFTEIVNNIQFYLQNSPGVLKALSEQTGISESNILSIVSSTNTSVSIVVENRDGAPTEAFSSLSADAASNRIVISDKLVKELGEVFNHQQGGDDLTDKAAFSMLTATEILSAFTEYGDRVTNGGISTGNTPVPGMPFPDPTYSSAPGAQGNAPDGINDFSRQDIVERAMIGRPMMSVFKPRVLPSGDVTTDITHYTGNNIERFKKRIASQRNNILNTFAPRWKNGGFKPGRTTRDSKTSVPKFLG